MVIDSDSSWAKIIIGFSRCLINDVINGFKSSIANMVIVAALIIDRKSVIHFGDSENTFDFLYKISEYKDPRKMQSEMNHRE